MYVYPNAYIKYCRYFLRFVYDEIPYSATKKIKIN